MHFIAHVCRHVGVKHVGTTCRVTAQPFTSSIQRDTYLNKSFKAQFAPTALPSLTSGPISRPSPGLVLLKCNLQPNHHTVMRFIAVRVLEVPVPLSWGADRGNAIILHRFCVVFCAAHNHGQVYYVTLQSAFLIKINDYSSCCQRQGIRTVNDGCSVPLTNAAVAGQDTACVAYSCYLRGNAISMDPRTVGRTQLESCTVYMDHQELSDSVFIGFL